ncbi:hypothetical protein [Streptomyces gobiensis]|uniref:hypothetical protein n=1 Tax=Streptomyces gobiensis TaxID=2875706 RepID=UPI001E53F646|nr:hypothetical protein [Streptomyces gobiensis]UGY91031.1 hypothetical protein test1122_04360 [Streptomyces gobiensis]
MTSQTLSSSASSPVPPEPIDIEQAEAALIEHYPRLVRLGYLVLPPALGRHRRVLTAHALAQRSLPRGRAATETPPLPTQRGYGGRTADPGYAYVRLRVLRAALTAERPRRIGRWELSWLPRVPPPLPQVLGLRLFPRSGGADELALDQALCTVSGAARAAYVLRDLEGMADADVRKLLAAAGVDDPHAALTEANGVRSPAGSRDRSLLESVEFDPCSLQARPTDLMRRRQHGRAAIAAVAALAVCGLLLGLPGDTWGRDGAAAPAYARNPAAQRALDPAKLHQVRPAAWQSSARTDFSAWPARGELTGDKELLRRALAVWARPGGQVNVTATPGTQAGPAAGPAQLLYAGEVDGASVVLLHDGLRVVRYAEPRGGEKGPVGLDFARTDTADTASSTAVLLTRSDGNARYLTAPWVTDVTVLNLLKPGDDGRVVKRREDGVTDPVTSPPLGQQRCGVWPALRITAQGGAKPYLLTDLGELTPARLTHGAPDAEPRDALGSAARASLARTACHLSTVSGGGVRTVNSWVFAEQRLPEGDGKASWVCTRAETWRGPGSRVLAQFQAPGKKPGTPGAVTAQAADSPVCGPRDQRVLSGVLWKSSEGDWHLLAAGSEPVASITATGGVTGSSDERLLAVPAKKGAQAELSATLKDGGELGPLK